MLFVLFLNKDNMKDQINYFIADQNYKLIEKYYTYFYNVKEILNN